MFITKTEMQIRSEALDDIERVLSKMYLKLGSAKPFLSTDPQLTRQHLRNKGTLNRIDLEVKIARSDIGDTEDPETEIKGGRFAKILQFAR